MVGIFGLRRIELKIGQSLVKVDSFLFKIARLMLLEILLNFVAEGLPKAIIFAPLFSDS
jgi:hypothetical protein